MVGPLGRGKPEGRLEGVKSRGSAQDGSRWASTGGYVTWVHAGAETREGGGVGATFVRTVCPVG